jgi:hypothetical protein
MEIEEKEFKEFIEKIYLSQIPPDLELDKIINDNLFNLYDYGFPD